MLNDAENEIEYFKNSITEEQYDLFEWLTLLQQDVSMRMLCTPGMTWAKSYRESPYSESTNKNSIAVMGHRIKKDLNVQRFMKTMAISELDSRIANREEVLILLTRQMRGSLNDVLEFKSKFLGMTIEKDGEEPQAEWGNTTYDLKHVDELDPDLIDNIAEISRNEYGIKIKMYSSREAAKDLAKLQGLNSATQHKHTIEGNGNKDDTPLIRISFVEGAKKPDEGKKKPDG